MKQSDSSRLDDLRKRRKAVTSSAVRVRQVKFTPQEMAYEAPVDTSDWVFAGRGPRAIFAKAPTVIALDPDVAKVFKNSETVNRALRKLLEAVPVTGKKKKTA